MKLTPRQRRFVAAYAGNATEAAKAAGYSAKTAKAQGSRLLTNANVAEAIRRRETKVLAKHIATREERQQFWTTVMHAESEEMRDRLKASELLGRSVADFTEKHEIKGELGLLELVRESMAPEPSNEPPKQEVPSEEPST